MNTAKSMFWTALGAVLALVFLAFVFEERKPPASATPVPEAVIQPVVPIPDGNGLYYFPVVGEQYRRALWQFYTDHPDMNCAYHGASEGYDGGNYINGHILRCHKRDTAVPAQDINIP